MKNVLWKKCELCDNLMEIKLVNKPNSLKYGKPIKSHSNKRFCSKKCQIEWQKK